MDSFITVEANHLRDKVRDALHSQNCRLAFLTSITGKEIITGIIRLDSKELELWQSPVSAGKYPAVSLTVPQAHWFERRIKDMFGIEPTGHPRNKSCFTEKAYATPLPPLYSAGNSDTMDSADSNDSPSKDRDFSFLTVEGPGVYELPVGPVHAGIIEPGHFRLSCLGEYIQNLELRFGFVHRGVESNLTKVPWQNTRHLCEASVGDTTVANALANSLAFEKMLNVDIDDNTRLLRALALEIERLAMHTTDLGGMAVDLGIGSIASTLSILRGRILKLAELLTGSRLMRGFICPGGITRLHLNRLNSIKELIPEIEKDLNSALHSFTDSAYVHERLEKTGIVSKEMASAFGLVGPAARASGIDYDARQVFGCDIYDRHEKTQPSLVVKTAGDAFARTKVRMKEAEESLRLMAAILENDFSDTVAKTKCPDNLPPNSVSTGVVEAYRGELIHFIATDENSNIQRYFIKDPSLNNWTGMAIAARGELIADFPICNKSFSLSYSGHDL